jgi:CMP/dCMP kinase
MYEVVRIKYGIVRSMLPIVNEMKKRIITLGGLPGSGKSTVKRLLAEKLGYTMLSTGDFVRDMAYARNLTLEEFNDLIIHDKTLDEEIDSRLIEAEATGDRCVVDSHLAFHFIPSGFSVLLTVSLEKSAERIFNDAKSPTRIKSGDTMQTLEEARERTAKRIQNHVDRYKLHYGVDPYHPESYDFVIDTEQYSPAEVATRISEAYAAWIAPETP